MDDQSSARQQQEVRHRQQAQEQEQGQPLIMEEQQQRREGETLTPQMIRRNELRQRGQELEQRRHELERLLRQQQRRRHELERQRQQALEQRRQALLQQQQQPEERVNFFPFEVIRLDSSSEQERDLDELPGRAPARRRPGDQVEGAALAPEENDRRNNDNNLVPYPLIAPVPPGAEESAPAPADRQIIGDSSPSLEPLARFIRRTEDLLPSLPPGIQNRLQPAIANLEQLIPPQHRPRSSHHRARQEEATLLPSPSRDANYAPPSASRAGNNDTSSRSSSSSRSAHVEEASGTMTVAALRQREETQTESRNELSLQELELWEAQTTMDENGDRKRRHEEISQPDQAAEANRDESSKQEDERKPAAAKPKTSKSVLETLTCPITLELPLDPVMAEDGIIYERSSIEEHLQRSDKSPIKNVRMGNKLIESHQVKSMIESLVENASEQEQGLVNSYKERLDQKKVIDGLVAQAQAGNVPVMLQVAENYYEGKNGFVLNQKRGFHWYSKAADEGNAVGMALAGIHLLQNSSTEIYPRIERVRKQTTGLSLVSSAAHEYGSDQACIFLGEALADGKYLLERNVKRAIKLLQLGVSGDCQYLHASEETIQRARRRLSELLDPASSNEGTARRLSLGGVYDFEGLRRRIALARRSV